MQCVSSLVVIYSVVHFKTNGSLEKRYKVKPGQTSALLSQSTLEKELSFIEDLLNLFFCYSQHDHR